MTKLPRPPIAGVSWTVRSLRQKGFESFAGAACAEGAQRLLDGGSDLVGHPAPGVFDGVIPGEVSAGALLAERAEDGQ